MQVFGLPGHLIRCAKWASRFFGAGNAEPITAMRVKAVRIWRDFMKQGLTAEQAAQKVGHSRATLYRWERNPAPSPTDGRRRRKPEWSDELVKAVERLRLEYPAWGKFKIVRMLPREGHCTSESTVGRILKFLRDRKRIGPVPVYGKAKSARKRVKRPFAVRLPRGRKAKRPGELVQIDHMSINGTGGQPVKQITACDPVSKRIVSHGYRRATAANAAEFLAKVIREMPFPVTGIQVDGGSEFMGVFEEFCQRTGLELCVIPPRTPELNGCVERLNGTLKREFWAVWEVDTDDLEATNLWIDAFCAEFNSLRPHQGLGGLTPDEFLASLGMERAAA